MHSRIIGLLLVVLPPCLAAQEPRKTENLVVVTLDGFRRQELFGGADDSLLDAKQGVRDLAGLKKSYQRPTAEERRKTLMPFFWNVVVPQGQLFGDLSAKAPCRSTNGLKFSYPGYHEMFGGYPDPRIDSNNKRQNPNPTVFEFLQGRPGFKDRIGICCTWDVFPSIFADRRSGLKVHAGWTPLPDEPGTRDVNRMVEQLPRYWPGNTFDLVTMRTAEWDLAKRKPRVLYVGLGETDEWGHARRYDLYLDAAHKTDRWLEGFWNGLQKMPQYAGKTSLLITTDHGRGPNRQNWTDHGKNVPDAEFMWVAVLGPDTPSMGIRSAVATTQSQVAATIAHLLGEDFRQAQPKAAAPLPGVVR